MPYGICGIVSIPGTSSTAHKVLMYLYAVLFVDFGALSAVFGHVIVRPKLPPKPGGAVRARARTGATWTNHDSGQPRRVRLQLKESAPGLTLVDIATGKKTSWTMQSLLGYGQEGNLFAIISVAGKRAFRCVYSWSENDPMVFCCCCCCC